MSLTVITNERYFYPDTLAPDERHLGTRDRFDVSKQYDYPGKAVGCLKAAKMLQHRTLPRSDPDDLGTVGRWPGKGGCSDMLGKFEPHARPEGT